MKLIKAHIQNFGKLSNVDIDFSDGLNAFIHENGWGKTTLSVFIKSMFYGMEHTTSKDIEKNEKLKYAPWQGGVYGGTLAFLHGEKIYIIHRTFGLKKNEDTFELRDVKTNKISDDFSENIGNELFGINRETYGRSVHVVLDESPVASDDISAKLNNLVEASDISSFDTAVAFLDKKATALKAKRGNNGEIAQIQNTIEENRNALVGIESKILQNENYEKKIAELNKRIEDLKKTQRTLEGQLAESAKYEAKLRYEQLKADVRSAQKSKESLLLFFNGKVPTDEAIGKLDALIRSYTTVESNLQTGSATQAEKDQYDSLRNYFAGDILPSKEQIDSCLKADGDYKRFKQEESEKKLTEAELAELSALKPVFEDSNLSAEKINENIAHVSEVQDMKNEVARLESELQSKRLELKLALQTKPKNFKRIAFFISAALCILAGAASFAFRAVLPVSAGLLALGAFFVVSGFASKSRNQDFSELEAEISALETKIQALRASSSEKENGYKVFISQYGASEDSELVALTGISVNYNRYATLSKKNADYSLWLKTQAKNPEDYENALKAFMKRYCKTEDISSVPAEIQALTERLNRLSELEKKMNADSHNARLQDSQKESLKAVLSQYDVDKTFSFADQVQSVHDRLNDIKNAGELIASSMQKVKDFEANPENDVSSFEKLSKPEKSAEALREELSGIAEQIVAENRTVADYQKIINDNLTHTEKKEDIETEIERLEITKKEKQAEYEILQKTQQLLSKAKENLDANYSDPMKKGFEKYVSMLDSKLKLAIDTDLKVSVDDGGKYHESAALSEGYKDLVNFCSRMALIDALFKDEKPPIILDDPFVNLDDDKVPLALQLIKDMAKEKQVLYFACHKSRAVR